MLADFETIKRSFRADHDKKRNLLVDLYGVVDNKEDGIEDSSIILNRYVSLHSQRAGPTATAEPN